MLTDDIVDPNVFEFALGDTLVPDELEDWVPPDDEGTDERSAPV